MNPISVLIVDDHALFRMGLRSVLGTLDDITVVADAADGDEAVRKSLKFRPDVILTDLMMPGLNGAETTAAIRERLPGANVLVLTTFSTSDGIAQALNAGARGAVLKSADVGELHRAIRAVAAGREFISPEISRIMEEDPPLPALSPRQLKILESITRGLTSADIAKELGISYDVVREHTQALFLKLGAANRAEAAAIAVRRQIVKT